MGSTTQTTETVKAELTAKAGLTAKTELPQNSDFDDDLKDDLEKGIAEDQDQRHNSAETPNATSIPDKMPTSDIPDVFRGPGLMALIGQFIINISTWGSNAAFALYLQQFLNESSFAGAKKIDFGVIGGLAFSSGTCLAPVINYATGKLGIKPTICAGIVFQFVGIFLAAYAKKLWQLYLTFGFLQGLGLSCITLPAFPIVSQWFKGGRGGKRNIAMGIASAGIGVGGIVFNLGLQPIVTKYSYHWAMRAEAIICAVLGCIGCTLLTSRNKDIKPIYNLYDRLVWTNAGVIMLYFWTATTMLGYVVLLYNLGDFTRSLGYDSRHASIVSAMISVGIIYGRPAVGYVGDIIGPTQVTIVASWIVGLLSFAMWIPCRNYATAIAFALLQGSLMGTVWVTMSTITGAVVGLRKFGIGLSCSLMAVGMFGVISPIIGIELKADGPASPTQYEHPAIFVGCCFMVAGFILCFLRAWIIARCKYHADEYDPAEGDESILKLKVSLKELLSCFFTFGPRV